MSRSPTGVGKPNSRTDQPGYLHLNNGKAQTVDSNLDFALKHQALREPAE